ncbi:MAG: translation elongation factor 4 [Candidatus Borkfalkiaceae bacterium]|nr:translation elongation factor 4 [Christensenellaceae bacterium]
MSVEQKKIRNFCIVAHIDHGKSTLADRLMEMTGQVSERDMEEQLLDSMDLERERGITIKLTPVRMFYKAKDGEEYVFNLIDTPGHVDFSYEVSRSLKACEGAILIVDATQGVQAQTLANAYLAIDNDLEIMPVINKMDLASANPDAAAEEIENILGIDASDAPRISAKSGLNVDEVLEQIVKKIPAPTGDPSAPLKALIFDSFYDNFKGVICFVRVVDGSIKVGTRIKTFMSGKAFTVTETGVFSPKMLPTDGLSAGEVGYIAASVKSIEDTEVGDTITDADNPADKPLPGYKKALPMVFSGVFPLDGSKYNDLKDALLKLKLNDAALSIEPDNSVALGFGFRCGFLGLLHMDVIQERIEREFNLEIITTAPSVSYKVYKTDGSMLVVENPTHLPPVTEIAYMEEPVINAQIFTPPEFVGPIMELCQYKRGVYKDLVYLDKSRVSLKYTLPLNEIIYDFFDQLKSRTKGYASLDYEIAGYEKSDLVKLDMLLNGDVCDALSIIVHKDKAYERGRQIAERLKDVIPRQMFEIPIQAAVGGKIIARETVKAYRKDVLAKCYGGDVTRKKKLLEKQKEGKKKMRSIGSVEIPSEAFIEILKTDNDK